MSYFEANKLVKNRSSKVISYAQVVSTPTTSFKAKDVGCEVAPAFASTIERIVNNKLGNRPIREDNPNQKKKTAAIK